VRALEIFSEILAPGGVGLTLLGLAGRAWQRRETTHRHALEKRDAEWQERLDEMRDERDTARAERDEMRLELRQSYKDLALAAAYVQFAQRSSRTPESSGTTPREPPSIPSLSASDERRLPAPPRLPRIKTPR